MSKITITLSEQNEFGKNKKQKSTRGGQNNDKTNKFNTKTKLLTFLNLCHNEALVPKIWKKAK